MDPTIQRSFPKSYCQRIGHPAKVEMLEKVVAKLNDKETNKRAKVKDKETSKRHLFIRFAMKYVEFSSGIMLTQFNFCKCNNLSLRGNEINCLLCWWSIQ